MPQLPFKRATDGSIPDFLFYLFLTPLRLLLVSFPSVPPPFLFITRTPRVLEPAKNYYSLKRKPFKEASKRNMTEAARTQEDSEQRNETVVQRIDHVLSNFAFREMTIFEQESGLPNWVLKTFSIVLTITLLFLMCCFCKKVVW